MYAGIIQDAKDNYDNPLEQLRAIVITSADKGERFHFLFHAMDEIAYY